MIKKYHQSIITCHCNILQLKQSVKIINSEQIFHKYHIWLFVVISRWLILPQGSQRFTQGSQNTVDDSFHSAYIENCIKVIGSASVQ